MINKNQIKRNELGCRSSQKVPKFGLLWRSVMLLGKIQFSQFHRIKSRQFVITWIKSSFVNSYYFFVCFKIYFKLSWNPNFAVVGNQTTIAVRVKTKAFKTM